MPEIIGGAMMVVGGATLSAGSIACARAILHRPIEAARQLLGDSSPAVPRTIAPDMAALLDQIP
ncbi:hypothetical protein KV697_10910 [Sphingomonas sanguinis]|uniref:hypothetical protein n=1 Tax=Sphingomonas sanguinis TaxID=33051 RepID=UPI001C586409|nr:hypothetical protein [Sphingomonas sanguinis]QXT34344.1 hypothetical protein KV697_10910 [Sphingomonas sanguinis]